MASRIQHEEMTAEAEADLGRRAQQGDIEARNQLLLNNLPLAQKIAQEFDLDPDMAESIGSQALLSAIHYFDPDRGRFSTIASLCLRHTFINYIKSEQRHTNLVSLDISNPFEDDERPLFDKISTNEPTPFDVAQKTNLFASVPKLLNLLTEPEKRVVTQYLGLDGGKRCAYREIGESENLSRESVRLYLVNALEKMRRYFKTD